MCVAEVVSHRSSGISGKPVVDLPDSTSPWQRQVRSRLFPGHACRGGLAFPVATFKPFQGQLKFRHLDISGSHAATDCKYREKEGAPGSSHFE